MSDIIENLESVANYFSKFGMPLQKQYCDKAITALQGGPAVRPLVWSEVSGPKGGEPSFYDHVVAASIFGDVIIEWKSWKDFDDPGSSTPWGTYVSGVDLEEAKGKVQSEYESLVLSALRMEGGA